MNLLGLLCSLLLKAGAGREQVKTAECETELISGSSREAEYVGNTDIQIYWHPRSDPSPGEGAG